ncbi:bifunctional homocysteine S-methyltransferase/methylenetetrahydrofolate reductase [bacterium]|nr:bifunctional homocysteine S-methyltransferase/methylenetetrahydrofolate reductase [bacterium]
MIRTKTLFPAETILIGSGAMGTELRKMETTRLPFVELFNLEKPESVKAIHKAYKNAGSNILVTNTFAANAITLSEANAESICEKINKTGVDLAREVAGDDCLVWASVGPLSLGLKHDDYTDQQLLDTYAEQCHSVTEADAIVLETFVNLREARAALKAATSAGLPVVFQMGNTGRGSTGRTKMDALLSAAEEAKVSAFGTNCRHPDEIVEVIRYVSKRTSLPLTSSPNAGNPNIVRGYVTYDFPPVEFLNIAKQLVEQGASLIGGCCGTTPEHIRLIASELVGVSVKPRLKSVKQSYEITTKIREKTETPNTIRQLMNSDTFLISVEIRADKTLDLLTICNNAKQIVQAGADLLNVPDNAGATIGRDASVVASRLQETTGVPSIFHKTVTQTNLLSIHSTLIGCWDLGLQGILAVTGDSPSLGSLAHMASRVSDLKSSVELLRLVRTLRSGQTISGERIANPPDFCAGCAIGKPTIPHIDWLKKKKEAGAEFVFSQPVFTIDDFQRLHDQVGKMELRFFPGLMPLLSLRNAAFLAGGRIPGISVPENVIHEFSRYEDREDQRKLGMDHAFELAETISKEAKGIYIIMPFGKSCYSDTARIVSMMRSQHII